MKNLNGVKFEDETIHQLPARMVQIIFVQENHEKYENLARNFPLR